MVVNQATYHKSSWITYALGWRKHAIWFWPSIPILGNQTYWVYKTLRMDWWASLSWENNRCLDRGTYKFPFWLPLCCWWGPPIFTKSDSVSLQNLSKILDLLLKSWFLAGVPLWVVSSATGSAPVPEPATQRPACPSWHVRPPNSCRKWHVPGRKSSQKTVS